MLSYVVLSSNNKYDRAHDIYFSLMQQNWESLDQVSNQMGVQSQQEMHLVLGTDNLADNFFFYMSFENSANFSKESYLLFH